MTTNPISIELSERLSDHWIDVNGQSRPKYHAQIKDEPGIWGCGKSPIEAVGDLILARPERFGVEIVNLGQRNR